MAKAVNEFIDVNGTRQSILTMYTDTNNPVLLIVHGGAGMPDRALVQAYNSELADCYTVVCWDQRGSGFSTMRGRLTIDLMLSDLAAVVDCLRDKYHQERIVIAGHSWGAYLALRYVAAHQDRVRYYIGTGQHISPFQGEIDRYRFVRAEAQKRNKKSTVWMLDSFGAPDGYTYPHMDAAAKAYVALKVVGYAGYFSRSNGVSMAKYVRQYLGLYRQCYGAHFPKALAGMVRPLLSLNLEMDRDDYISEIKELSVPVLLVSGEEDMICPVPAAQRWLEQLTAPKKDFVIIKNASHMVNFEQPQKWNRLVKSVLEESN
ncbi:MAG: alpha/beta hydrolase [Clostridia bacterium]|nr:alpha/beta hydrolase [Clostridia bacterium]